MSTADDLRAALIAANPHLSRFNPLGRILSYDDFVAGLGGWCQLIGNHRGGDLDSVPVSKRDLRPPQLSNLSFFDIGTHGAMHGAYALKLATRPVPRSTAVAIKRLTAMRPGRVRFEMYFTFKAEATFDGAEGDGNADPSEARFGDFTISNDVNLPGAKRFLLTLRYVNTDAAGRFVQKWMYNTSVHPTTKMQLTGDAADDAGFDLHALHPDDWIAVPGGHQTLCYNEVPTKINWHYLCWTFDTGEQRHVELRVNDRVMDLRDLPVPFYEHDYVGLDGLLNFLVDVRTHQPVRNFVWVDSALISVVVSANTGGETRMQTAHTAVVERNETYTGDFTTEPYEAGWASEARWFVQLAEMQGCRVVRVFAQVSPDGLHWCDDSGPVRLTITAAGLHSFAMRDFGQWLRLRCAVEGDAPRLRVTVTLALKG